jgi:NADH-quinone oxidoreductase subunit M
VGEEKAGGIEFYLGADRISLCMLSLTAMLTLVAVLASWTSITTRIAEFHALLLVLQAGLFGAFTAFDLITFYVFFELTLIPTFFLVHGWGGAKRVLAARKLFFYTLVGGLIMLVGLVGLAVTVHLKSGHPLTFSIPELAALMQTQMDASAGFAPAPNGESPSSLKSYWYSAQLWIFLALFVGFAIKTPIVPFHTWLPLAYTEAPVVGTLMMAGVLSKLGCYGFLRICAPLLPYAAWNIGLPIVGTLAAIGIVYGALCALAQTDLKRMVAYSSISHLGFVVLGIFALNVEGLAGGAFQMLNHGLITGSLFLLVGAVEHRYGTREIGAVGGLAGRMPAFAFLLAFFVMASAGLPGLNGFVGEVLTLAGMFARDPIIAAMAALGIVLGAWYLLTILQRTLFGPLKETFARSGARDLDAFEFASLAPMAILCLALGIMPSIWLDHLRVDVAGTAALYDQPEHLRPPPSVGPAIAEAQ